MKHETLIYAAALSGMFAANAPVWAESDDQITVDDVQDELSEAYDEIARYSAQERDDALTALDNTLRRIDDQIEVLEQRARQNWANMSQAARDRTTVALQELRARRNRLAQTYGALTHGADAAWDELVFGVTRAWEDLEAAWDDAVNDANINSEK